MPQKITLHLWFDDCAEEAVEHYTSIFPNSRTSSVGRYPEGSPGPAGGVMVVEFELDGQRFLALNGGPQFEFNEALSLLVECETQEEIDFYWERLSDGGEEGQCGWLKDRFGLSWQVSPKGMDEVFSGDDPERAKRMMDAFMKMRKIDMAALQEAGA